MDNTADVIFRKNLQQQGLIPHVSLVKLQLFARELLPPLQGLGIGIAQIVNDHNAVAALQQLQAGVGTDITGSAGDKNIHCLTSKMYLFRSDSILPSFPGKINGEYR